MDDLKLSLEINVKYLLKESDADDISGGIMPLNVHVQYLDTRVALGSFTVNKGLFTTLNNCGVENCVGDSGL